MINTFTVLMNYILIMPDSNNNKNTQQNSVKTKSNETKQSTIFYYDIDEPLNVSML